MSLEDVKINITLTEEFAKRAAHNGRDDADFDLLNELVEDHEGILISVMEEVLKNARNGDYDEKFDREQIGRLIDQAMPEFIVMCPEEEFDSIFEGLDTAKQAGLIRKMEL